MTEIEPVTYIHRQTLTEVTLPSKEHSGGARSRVFRGSANGDNGTCLFGCLIHGNPWYGADPVGRPVGLIGLDRNVMGPKHYEQVGDQFG